MLRRITISEREALFFTKCKFSESYTLLDVKLNSSWPQPLSTTKKKTQRRKRGIFTVYKENEVKFMSRK